MKNIAIDLGSHKLEGLRNMLEKKIIDEKYYVHCYEANPYVYEKSLLCKSEFCFLDLKIFNKAVSNYNGKALLNLDESKTSQGCNILENPPDQDPLWKTKYSWTSMETECISIISILENIGLEKDDNIVLKCDIEGSEFEVLSSILDSEYVKNFKTILVEWHERLWHPNIEEKLSKKNKIINKIKEKNIELLDWE